MDQSIVKAIHQLAEKRNQLFVDASPQDMAGLMRSRSSQQRRHVSLVHSRAAGEITRMQKIENQTIVDYTIYYEWLFKQREQLYVEERQEFRRASFENRLLTTDNEIIRHSLELDPKAPLPLDHLEEKNEYRSKNRYNRREAVRYAERLVE
ncbi:hypothetical protein [Alkalicoccobacillus plakortidis]|uniref:Uncharacterized protein n=1 Tax=Alkalicoccobacillus plakortidis TaxID=444060 RepID=A0ABT0XLE4_9BACI|nr:hypothetical protein [Alkalicoccobacillus plakortidis]MCM2676733.1 hypothetical protein [Alkalicoccobacillus plakortidis]